MANRDPNPPTLLSTLGEEIIRIITPVSACMLIVVLLVTVLSSGGDSTQTLSSIATIAYPESPTDSPWVKLKGAVFNSLVFVAVVTLTTFGLVALFYFRCTNFLKWYMGFSSFIVLLFLGGQVTLLLVNRFAFPIDVISFFVLLLNFSVVGVMSVFLARMPIFVTQGYLVVVGVLVAYFFTMLPEWTTWALLVAMSLYDLAAVLLPGGPLRLLVELAISRNEELPALVYEARPVEPLPNSIRRVWRERSSNSDNSIERRDIGTDQVPVSNTQSNAESTPNVPTIGNLLQETTLVIDEEGSQAHDPLIRRQLDTGAVEEGHEGIGLGSSGAIKLGLGDFIFYSVLVGRAALYDFMTTSVMEANFRDYVEIVFENYEDTVQSWHIDGYSFWVVGMDGGQWRSASRDGYNLRDAVARCTVQVYPQSWSAVYMPLDNVGMWNIRSENWARQYLGQQLYLRVYSPVNSWRDENPIPINAFLCGRASGRKTRPL